MQEHQAFPTKYFKAAMLKDEPQTFVIISMTMESISSPDGSSEDKPVLGFEDVDQRLVLNKTNWKNLAKLFGRDSTEWEGRHIELYQTTTELGSDTVDCIRLRLPKDEKPPQRGDEPLEDVKGGDFNDEVPI